MSLLFFIALLVVGWLLYNLYLKKLLQQGQPGKVKLALIVLGVIFLVMAATGRAPALFALLGAAMTQVFRIAPLLIRFAPSLRQFWGSAIPGAAGASQGAGVSRVTTATIDMTLDHSTGTIDGLIKQGPFVGRQLSQLSLAELTSVYAYCQQNDGEALRLVQTYAARARSGEWQEPHDEQEQGQDSNHPAPNNAMSVAEARQILGVNDSASKQDIVQAHRSLMSRLHPDKGGSNYLAAKVNSAKQCLLDALAAK